MFTTSLGPPPLRSRPRADTHLGRPHCVPTHVDEVRVLALAMKLGARLLHAFAADGGGQAPVLALAAAFTVAPFALGVDDGASRFKGGAVPVEDLGEGEEGG